MKIVLSLEEPFGRTGAISFEERFSDAFPDDTKIRLEADLYALLKVFGGLALAVVEDSMIHKDEPSAPGFIEELMAVLEDFSVEKLQQKV